jgi:hypothetical protein
MGLFSFKWWIVPICVVFSMINGSVYYNPKTLFGPWWKVVGNGKEQPGSGNMAGVWIATIIAAAVKAIFVGAAVNAFGSILGEVTVATGLLTAVLLTGVLAPAYLVNKMFAGHGVKVWAIEVGNHLIDFLAYGVLFGLLK